MIDFTQNRGKTHVRRVDSSSKVKLGSAGDSGSSMICSIIATKVDDRG